jgi:hypothetical protein
MSGTSYFCCHPAENPWDNIFGCGGTHSISSETIPVSQDQFKSQDWNNPFGTDRSTVASSQSQSQSQVYKPDSRSIGSYDYSTSRLSDYDDRLDVNSTKKKVTFKEPHFENISPSFSSRKHMDLHSFLDQGFDAKSKECRQGLGPIVITEKMEKKLNKRGLVVSPVEGKRFVKKDSLSIKRKLQLLVMRTETSRPKKELTPEDVRDPETVPGMKLLVDIEKENQAKERAATMISSGEYLHNEKAGVAIYSLSDRGQVNRTDAKVNPIV